MKCNLQKLLSVILSACLALALALPALAAGDGDDPNVYLNKGVYKMNDWTDTDSTYVFDPATGTLTINDNGNGVPVNDELAFYAWIKSIADGVKTVFIPKTSELRNFSIQEASAEDIECYGEDYHDAYNNHVFWKAFSYLRNLERFEVEKGNMFFESIDGVLYTRHGYDLVHYPAARPGKTYQVNSWCMRGLYPYAFCNTRCLERLELPYCRCRNLCFFSIEDYALSALDLDTGEEKQSSLRQIVFYGTGEEFHGLASVYEGNNAAMQAEIVSKPTDIIHDIITYFKANIFIYLRSTLDSLPYQTLEKTDLFPFNMMQSKE